MENPVVENPLVSGVLRTRAERTIRAILRALLLALPLITAMVWLDGGSRGELAALGGMTAWVGGLFVLSRSGHFMACVHGCVLGLIVFATAVDASYGSVRGAGTFAYVGAIIVAGIFLTRTGLAVATVASIACVGALIAAQAHGLLAVPQYALGAPHWVIYALSFSVIAIIVQYSQHMLAEVAQRMAGELEERRRAEAAQAQIESKYAVLFATSPHAICIADAADGRHLEVNDAWVGYTGYEREHVIDRNAAQLGLWLDEEARRQVLERLQRDGRVANQPARFRMRDGRVRDVLLSAAALDLDGRRCIVWSWGDLSELHAAQAVRLESEAAMREAYATLERRVADRTADLQAANRELESFSYSVSHDLRAPLRAIAGFSAILREDFAASVPPAAAEYLERIEQNAVRMGQLIDDLLELSRAGRAALAPARVDMAALAHAVLADLRASAGRADISIDALPAVTGDATLLRQVWQNLIANAIKFSARVPAPRIEIGATARNGEAEFWVRDNGAGFDMRYAGKLFGIFQRLHSPAEFEGTGVGLAIVQRIVARHGGRVSAEGEPGAGATFRFVLPAQPPAS